jgi:hypothetical protein
MKLFGVPWYEALGGFGAAFLGLSVAALVDHYFHPLRYLLEHGWIVIGLMALCIALMSFRLARGRKTTKGVKQ